jgi:hypothetical protein
MTMWLTSAAVLWFTALAINASALMTQGRHRSFGMWVAGWNTAIAMTATFMAFADVP